MKTTLPQDKVKRNFCEWKVYRTRIRKIPVLIRALPVLERVPVLTWAFFPMPMLVLEQARLNYR